MASSSTTGWRPRVRQILELARLVIADNAAATSVARGCERPTNRGSGTEASGSGDASFRQKGIAMEYVSTITCPGCGASKAR